MTRIGLPGVKNLPNLALYFKIKIMQALIIIDAQNEFSENGKRPVPGINAALVVISERVKQARANGTPIAWVRHFNKPEESPAFKPGTWGSEFLPGFGPDAGSTSEIELHKNVYGASPDQIWAAG